MFYRIAAVAIILAMTAAALASLPYGEKKLTADGNVTVLGSSEVEVPVSYTHLRAHET